MTKRDAKDEKKAPKLRFKGFTDDWEQVPLENIIKVNSGRDYKFANPGDIPVYGTGGYMLSIDTKLSDEDAVGIGRKGTINKPFFLKAPFWTVDTIFYLTSRNQNNIHFLLPLFQKINWKRYDESTGVPSLSKSTINKIRVNIPKIEEQRNVALLFQSLDHTITLHEEKQKQLEQLKKALLQKMFADKSGYPKVRFKGFSEPWEQVKFGKITSKYKTRNKDGEELRSFSVSNIYGFIPQEEQFENGGIALNADKKNSIIVTPNSFAYNPARINVGSIGYYNGNENVLVSSLYEVFKLHKEYDPNYLWFWLKSNHFNWWIHRLQEGSVRSYFYYDKFSEIKERMPSLPEQMKIGQLLKSLDHTITLHAKKIESLKQLKQALLQQMFI